MFESIRHRRSLQAIAFVVLWALAQTVQAQPPTAPAFTQGNYSVSYTMGPAASFVYLEEKVGVNGAWQVVPSPNGPYYGGTVTFSNKPAGQYYYRKVDYVGYWDQYYAVSYYPEYSGETLVTVWNGPVPSIDPLHTQMHYRYESRYGDYNGDGRLDLFINRIAGGQAGNGTLGAFVLRQNADLSFTTLVPSPAEIGWVSGWPLWNLRLDVNDVDLDGFVDLNVGGINTLIGGAADQIVYAPGQLMALAPSGLRASTAALQMFLRDTAAWTFDSNYFWTNAIYSVPAYDVYWVCPPWGYVPDYDYWSYYYYYGYYCYPYPVFVGYANVFDAGTYSWDSFRFTDLWDRVEDAGGLYAGTADAIAFSQLFQTVFGRQLLKGVIELPGGDVIDLPNDIPIPDAPPKPKPFWRLLRIFPMIALEIEVLRYPLNFKYIFRIVHDAERASIAACQCFSLGPAGLEVKQFWITPVDGDFWALVRQRSLPNVNGGFDSNYHRSMVFTMIRKETYNAALPLIAEPGTLGHLDFWFGTTLPLLNADIATSPFGRIKVLREYPAEP